MIDNEEGKEAWNYICDLISKGGLVESFKEATTWDKVYEVLQMEKQPSCWAETGAPAK